MPSSFEDTAVKLLMENPLEWYSGYTAVVFELKRQATCRYKNGGHGRVDLSAHVYRPSKMAGGSYYNFEIKSCKSDMETDNGLNLFNMYNYFVYPRVPITMLPGTITYDMAVQKLKDIGCEHAGIIAVTSDDSFVIERKAKRYKGDGIPPAIKAYNFRIG